MRLIPTAILGLCAATTLLPATGANAQTRPAIPEVLLERQDADPACKPFSGEVFEGLSVVAALDANRKLVVLPCYSETENLMSRIYIHDTRYPRRIAPAPFPVYSGEMGWTAADTLANVEYDPQTKTLIALKNAGKGCGTAALYRWTDDGFRLQEMRRRATCDGKVAPKSWPLFYAYKQADKASNGR